MYYSLDFYYKIKEKFKIDCNFFNGKFCKRDGQIKKNEEHLLPCIKHCHQGDTIGYYISDESTTHSIPIFLRESESFIGKDGVNLIIINNVLYQQNYKSFSKKPKEYIKSFGLYYLVDFEKLKNLINEDLKEKNDILDDEKYKKKFEEYVQLIEEIKF